MKFQVIVADPPWAFSDGLKKMRDGVRRSAASQYRTMTAAAVAALPVPSLVDPSGCLLALWVPGCMLQHGLDVMQAWGFTYKQNYVWVKTKRDAIEDARPSRHQRKPCSYMSSTRLVVLLSGPPCVITKMMSNVLSESIRRNSAAVRLRSAAINFRPPVGF